MRGAGRLSPVPAQAPLDRVQGALPPALRSVPVQVLLAGSGLLVASVLVLFSVLVRSNRAIEALEDDTVPAGASASPAAAQSASAGVAAPRVSSSAAPTELDAARLGGADSLVVLAQRYPQDARVLEALCVAQARDKKDYAGSLRALRQLLSVAPEKRADTEVHEALIDIANGPPDVAAEAFDMMKTKMGTEGADVLFELLQVASGKYAKEHVAGALADPEVMKSASRALLVADELRRSLPCARKAFVTRAAADGDGRSLPPLRQMVAANCKAFFRGAECYQCFTPQERTAISAAIDAIEKREKR
jgi:hypothetical protein